MTRKPLQIFVSYSHEDAAWTRRLFDEYINTTWGDCRIWTDAQIRVGQQWDAEIQQHLDCASVAILLVSKRFLKSAFIMGQEYPRIIARRTDAAFRIVWIPVDVKPWQIERAAPELLRIQGATGLRATLPASPDRSVEPALVEQWRQQIRAQVQAAVDPIGAELARRVAPRYEIRQQLAEGNLAVVYQAVDRVLERTVAIKALKDKDQRGRFMDDVRQAIRTSDHASFVNVYDAGFDETATYCVLQYIEGRNLRQCIADHAAGHRGEGLPIDRIRRIFLGVASALAAGHAKHLSYGNIKPSNIVLDGDDRPFIQPACRRHDGGAVQRQRLLQQMRQSAETGQPADEADREDLLYLLPEHFGQQIEEIDDYLSDQYMLGLVAYEMIAGGLPDDLVDPVALAEGRGSAFAELPPLSVRRRLCPARIAAMVKKMTARRPADRYPDLQAVLREARLLEDLSLSIARDSYRRCATSTDFETVFFDRFYRAFIKDCPEAEPFFSRFRADDWARQHRMLKEAILLLFAFRQLDDGPREPNVLSRIAASHGAIPAYIYDRFVDALVDTVCGNADRELTAFDPECRDDAAQRELIAHHWRESVKPGVAYMQSRAPGRLTAGGLTRTAAPPWAADETAGLQPPPPMP